MIIELPKVRRDGQFKMTTIKVSSITGCEPCTVHYKGKKYDGVKVYTVDEGYFKVLADSDKFKIGWHHCLATGDMVSVDPIAALPAPKHKQLKA